MVRLHLTPFFLLISLLPATAIADGAALAEKIESHDGEVSDKQMRRWVARVKRFEDVDKAKFVAWARQHRELKGTWKKLGEPLAAIGTSLAAAELGAVARGHEVELPNGDILPEEVLGLLVEKGRFPLVVQVRELLLGMVHQTPSVQRRHRKELQGRLTNSHGDQLTPMLVALNEHANTLSTKSVELADEIGELMYQLSDDPDSPEALQEELQQLRAQQKRNGAVQAELVALIGRSFSAANDLDPYLFELVETGGAPSLAAGVAQGIRLRALRWKPEANPFAPEPEPELDEEPEEEAEPELDEFGEPVKKPRLRRRKTQKAVRRTVSTEEGYSPQVQAERRRLADALLSLAQREDRHPLVQLEAFQTLPVLERELSEEWAEVLFAALGVRGPVETAALAALIHLTGKKDLPASAKHWRKWWVSTTQEEEAE